MPKVARKKRHEIYDGKPMHQSDGIMTEVRFYEVKGKQYPFEVYHCEICGIVMTKPRKRTEND